MESKHVVEILDALKQSQFEQSKNYFSSPDVLNLVLQSPLDLMTPLIECFEKNKGNIDLLSTCEWMLLEVTRKVDDPNEIYLELLSHLEIEDDLNCVPRLLTMLKCVEVCLGRMTETKTRALEWCLKTIKETMDVLQFVEEEKLLKLYAGIEEIYVGAIKSFDTLKNAIEIQEQKQHISVFLLSQLTYTDYPEKIVIKFVESLTEVLPHLGYPLANLEERLWTENKQDTYHYLDSVISLSYEMLYYYVIHKRMCYTAFPQVYSPQYLFVHVGYLCSKLMLSPNTKNNKKGLDLLTDILSKVDPGSISHRALSAKHVPTLLQGLTNIMVFNSEFETRQEGSRTLKKLVFSFDERGRYLVLFHGFRFLDNQGVKGYMVTFVKELVVQYLNSGGYFMSKFPELLKILFILPQKDTTLLYECNDLVISLLNLLRYLIAVDPKPGKTTGVWTVEAEITDRFMKPMGSALQYSRNYLIGRMQDAQMLSKDQPSEATVQVGNETLPAPNYEDEVKGVNLSLTQLDFVQHIFDIVKEKFPNNS